MRAHAQTYAQTGKQKDDRLIDIHTDRHKQTGSRMLSRQVHIQESIGIGLRLLCMKINIKARIRLRRLLEQR